MNEGLTLGSLFDGSGGFPLGGLISGITPVWASEIEPFPIRVTTKRLPFMKHYGDVSVLNGASLEPVDIISFGSPCQDMSVAGKRAGLDGSRSNLFYEAVRIAKEMRQATNGQYPTWLCWENVPGAFSSNSGEDFKAVLDEIRRVKDPEADTPRPAKWPNAGCILADDHSIAWRVFDAQYWGVPQRRKRIYLVADLTGQRAGKVLFESEGLSGYTPEGFRSWQGTAGSAEECPGTPGGLCLNDQGGMAAVAGKAHTVYSTSKSSFHLTPEENLVNTLVATDYKDPPTVYEDPYYIVRRLTPVECARLQGFPDWWCAGLETDEPTRKDIEFWRGVFETHRRVTGIGKPKSDEQIVRWLENPHSDSAEYKLWGNGVALPCVCFVLAGIVYYARTGG